MAIAGPRCEEPGADWIRQQARGGKMIYAYFNNDINVRAPDNAMVLMEMVGKHAVKPLER